MDIHEFSAKFEEATKDMSSQEKQALMKMFKGISDEIAKGDTASGSSCVPLCNFI